MAGEEDLVSKVTVEGTEAATAQLDAYATQGSAAFDKLNKSAQTASTGIAGSNQNIERSNASVLSSFRQFAAIKIGNAATADLAKIEQGAAQLASAMRRGVPAIASFITRLAGVSTAAAAGGAALLKAAQNVAKGSDQQGAAIDKATAAQVKSNDASLQGQVAAINLESSQRQLLQQLTSGKITYSEYSASLKQLNADYKEQQRVSAQVENATERVRLENERLQKQAADQKAFQAQIALFGGPLLTSLTTLGRQAGTLFDEMKAAFGPVLAQAIDLISSSLSTNGQAISAFFTDAAKKATDFISKNGPAIQLALANIGSAIKQVFDGVINALPGFLDFFNNQLVPAVKSFGTVLSGAATVINSIFGTQLTGGAVAFIAILGSVTGAFKALIAVVRIFFALGTIVAGLPFGPVILLIVAAITLLLIAFPQLRQVALDVFNSIIQAFQGMAAGAANAVQQIVAAWNAIIAFFTGLFVAIGAVFATAWNAVVAGVSTAIDAVKAAWNATVQFFQSIIDQIVAFFVDLGTKIADAFRIAVDKVKQFFSDMWEAAKQKLGPILTLLQKIAALSASTPASGSDAAPVTAAGGGYIRGPGTPTSDSIPAWLSDKEYVVKAKSVAKYGLGMLHAINSGRFRMPKFNMGGLVSSMMGPTPRLAFADGGPVSTSANMRPLNLNLFGEQFNGLLAPEDVGERLGKYAVSKGTRSAGRKPAWVGRGRN